MLEKTSVEENCRESMFFVRCPASSNWSALPFALSLHRRNVVEIVRPGICREIFGALFGAAIAARSAQRRCRVIGWWAISGFARFPAYTNYVRHRRGGSVLMAVGGFLDRTARVENSFVYIHCNIEVKNYIEKNHVHKL